MILLDMHSGSPVPVPNANERDPSKDNNANENQTPQKEQPQQEGDKLLKKYPDIDLVLGPDNQEELLPWSDSDNLLVES